MKLKTTNPSFVRDVNNGAVLNTNEEAYKLFKQQREEKLRLQAIISDVDKLKTDISEIKSLLMVLINK